MKPLLIVLDDREGLIERSGCWSQVADIIEIHFLKVPFRDAPPGLVRRARFLMALRERTPLDEALFERMPNLELILQTGGHAYHIETVAAKKRGIVVALGRKAKVPLFSVPELTFALALSLVHRVHESDRMMHQGQWSTVIGRTLHGKRLGVLGLGRHGSRVAKIAMEAFGMQVAAWERPGNKYAADQTIQRFPLDELLKTSDILSIHLKLSEHSAGLLGRQQIGNMKKGAILINTSRGAIIDEHALVEALQEGRLSGAGLDVYSHEPLAADSPLRSLPNVILTPHIGWTVEEVFEEFAQIACHQLKEYLQGILPPAELLAL